MKGNKNVILLIVTVVVSITIPYAINAVAINNNRNITSYDINYNSNYNNATTDLNGNLVVFILHPAQDKFQKTAELYNGLVKVVGKDFLYGTNTLVAFKAGLYK